jgi:hypothetical protein
MMLQVMDVDCEVEFLLLLVTDIFCLLNNCHLVNSAAKPFTHELKISQPTYLGAVPHFVISCVPFSFSVFRHCTLDFMEHTRLIASKKECRIPKANRIGCFVSSTVFDATGEHIQYRFPINAILYEMDSIAASNNAVSQQCQ